MEGLNKDPGARQSVPMLPLRDALRQDLIVRWVARERLMIEARVHPPIGVCISGKTGFGQSFLRPGQEPLVSLQRSALNHQEMRSCRNCGHP